MSWNELGTGDCTALAEAIKHNSTITQLNLGYNGPGTGDCTALAEAIKHSSTITQLNLTDNELGTGDVNFLIYGHFVCSRNEAFFFSIKFT